MASALFRKSKEGKLASIVNLLEDLNEGHMDRARVEGIVVFGENQYIAISYEESDTLKLEKLLYELSNPDFGDEEELLNDSIERSWYRQCSVYTGDTTALNVHTDIEARVRAENILKFNPLNGGTEGYRGR